MPLGDSDLAAGVFFGDFGVRVQFGSQVVRGNLDAPGKDAAFSGVNVSDSDFRFEVARGAFNPAPKPRVDTVTVLDGQFAGSYKVQSSSPMDDGMLIELYLRSL